MRGGGITGVDFSDNSKNPNRYHEREVWKNIDFGISQCNWARIAQPVEHCTYEVTL